VRLRELSMGRKVSYPSLRLCNVATELDTDGNGRTSRAASYLVLCLKTGYLLPGKLTIPDQIAQDRAPYYKALEAADQRLAESGSIELTDMEKLLSTLLARQLYQVMKDAAGDLATPIA
jgi:hypothetical protein